MTIFWEKSVGSSLREEEKETSVSFIYFLVLFITFHRVKVSNILRGFTVYFLQVISCFLSLN